MKYYWEWCDKLYKLLKENRTLFLMVNTICFGVLGYMIWFGLHFFCLNRLDWLICFVGYSAMVAGYAGGLFYFMKID